MGDRRISVWWGVAIALALGFYARVTFAKVHRHAIIIGNNQGAPDEADLRYAEDDARKVHGILRSLGDFHEENMVLLLGEDPDTVQRVLIAVNDRIRSVTAGVDQAVLMVYYSGHADADALHLGAQRLDVDRLRQLVRGSAADVRVLVLDSCRSGGLTRVKGGTPVAPFSVELDQRLAGEGMVLLTSSSATEDAQESDELRGSFFTHYFVSALVGAGDRNGDDKVSLEEAYAYAYTHTLWASSRSLQGLQHPTYAFDIRGQGDIVLTRLHSPAKGRARLAFPDANTYLVFSDKPSGTVVAEVSARDAARVISVKEGRYFIRGRTRTHLLEGTVRAQENRTTFVDDRDLERIEYARLARKGFRGRRLAHGPLLGYQFRTSFWEGGSLCHGARLGYPVDLRWVSVSPSLGFCRGAFTAEQVEVNADEYDLGVAVTHVFDFPVVSIGLGALGGLSWLRQTFHGERSGPPRNTIGGHAGALFQLLWDLPRGFYIDTEVMGGVYVFRQQRGEERVPVTRAAFMGRPFFGVGKRF